MCDTMIKVQVTPPAYLVISPLRSKTKFLVFGGKASKSARVGLRTDEGVVESNTDLLEQGMSYVINQECVFGGHHVPGTSGFL